MICTSLESQGMHGSALIIYGASCSGKSTLSKELKQKLPQWEILEFDDVEIELKQTHEELTHGQVADMVIERALMKLENGINLIIDTNVFDESWITRLNLYLIGRIYVFCPLQILLLRNRTREIKLNRSARRSFYAKKYVQDTYQYFNSNSLYDLKIDSTLLTVPESAEFCLNHFHLK